MHLDIIDKKNIYSIDTIMLRTDSISSLGRRSFAVAGPTTWNSLSADLRDPTCGDECFRRSVKTFLPRDASIKRGHCRHAVSVRRSMCYVRSFCHNE